MKRLITIIIASIAILAGCVSCDPAEKINPNDRVTYLVEDGLLKYEGEDIGEKAKRAAVAEMRAIVMDINNT